MTKRHFLGNLIFLIFSLAVLISSCTKLVNEDDSNLGVFEAFWDIMDKNYVYFELKELDWSQIRKEYSPKFASAQSHNEVATLFQELIYKINDGHVWLSYKGKEVISNFSDTSIITLHYNLMQFHYQFADIRFEPNITFAQATDEITYLRISTDFVNADYFKSVMSEYNMSKGLIVDMRDCMGGSFDGLEFCKYFHKGKKVLCYRQFKNGTGHCDFTDFYPVYSIGDQIVNEDIKMVVIINRNAYSMGNHIVSALNDLRDCQLLGENTGGGGGSVLAVHLTGGWVLNYTFSRSLDVNKKWIEDGIEPDIEVTRPYEFWKNEHWQTGEDPQLEKALEILNR
ncbi:S41 family peptidase [Carboxylicivirga sp. N1Y90]|uniref:S41 family peptidase n=1 Tax=Carboxylicivirga fragile TaxID=3417571 RepID=UPI003D33B5AB|nr:hypothetical protein [Marinilabiliaceae bacterium N1Y90]